MMSLGNQSIHQNTLKDMPCSSQSQLCLTENYEYLSECRIFSLYSVLWVSLSSSTELIIHSHFTIHYPISYCYYSLWTRSKLYGVHVYLSLHQKLTGLIVHRKHKARVVLFVHKEETNHSFIKISCTVHVQHDCLGEAGSSIALPASPLRCFWEKHFRPHVVHHWTPLLAI